jgi:hypothetical protein
VGRFDEAMTEALGRAPEPAICLSRVVGYIHGRAGRRAEALEVLRALEAARSEPRSTCRRPTSHWSRRAWAIVRRR